MDWSKANLHRKSLVWVAILACIVIGFQSLSSSDPSSVSWLAPHIKQQDPSSLISLPSNSTRLKPSISVSPAPAPAPAPVPVPAPRRAAAAASVPAPSPVPTSAPSPLADPPPPPPIWTPARVPAPSPIPSPVVERLKENVSEAVGGKIEPAVATPKEVSPNKREIPQWRAKLEQDLGAAKHEIEAANYRNVQLDPQLGTKSIYHDAYKFHKSYELMEKLFKVYMYKEGEPRLVHQGPLTGIYSSEGRFIHEMNQNTRFLTDDPQEAHMFFLPYSVSHMVTDLYVPGSHSMLPLATFIKNYVNLVAAKHPFWNLTRGSDHFFVSCHDWGPATARDHPELRSNAVKVVCNADLTEEFVLNKDASLPETYLHTVKLPTKLGGPGASKRKILAFFAGQMHGRVRPHLIEQWKDKDPDMRIYEVLPREIAKKMNYVDHMKSSKFCICAMGYEVNSPRIVESIYYDCVPVLIADNFVLPFSDVLNWSAFSVTVSEKDIPRLKEILSGVSEEQYKKMQSRLKRVRQHFMLHDSAERFDMFHMILHSVWMRRLQQMDRITELETSAL